MCKRDLQTHKVVTMTKPEASLNLYKNEVRCNLKSTKSNFTAKNNEKDKMRYKI